jgi:hypothetical protein
MTADDLVFHWDWNADFCVPPFTVYIKRGVTQDVRYVSIKAAKGWNALTAHLRDDTLDTDKADFSWDELGENMLNLVELRYAQETIDGQAHE